MKKIDKLILSSFIGPFILTFCVVTFILLNINMLKYFDDLIGKGLGWDVIGALLFYFAVFTIPTALPLAVLMSSLIAFGNLGEHFELTAVKSLGISLIRSLVPIFVFILGLTCVAFYANNYWVPKAALEAYSLLYDIKQKKPALDLREGSFYNGIPDLSIKINERLPDGKTILGVIIYDHRGSIGNKNVTVADSGVMYTILNEQYLKLELFRGYNYAEGNAGQEMSGQTSQVESSRKTFFEKTQFVYDLSSFKLDRTDKKWFQGNRMMRNLNELQSDMDSLRREAGGVHLNVYEARKQFFSYHFKDSIPLSAELQVLRNRRDSLVKVRNHIPLTPAPLPTPIAQETTPAPAPVIKPIDEKLLAKIEAKSDTLFAKRYTEQEINSALGYARMMKNQLSNHNAILDNDDAEYKVFQIQWHSILSSSLACIAMFLIGAPLGAIIKKGGLGVPVLVSILFFILYYVVTLMGQKWAKQSVISVPEGVWAADAVLFLFGLVFLRQARVDARLFDADFYHVVWDKFKRWLVAKKVLKLKTA